MSRILIGLSIAQSSCKCYNSIHTETAHKVLDVKPNTILPYLQNKKLIAAWAGSILLASFIGGGLVLGVNELRNNNRDETVSETQVMSEQAEITQEATPTPTETPTTIPTSSTSKFQTNTVPVQVNNQGKIDEINSKIFQAQSSVNLAQDNINSLYAQSDKCYEDLRNLREQGYEVTQTQDCYQMYLPMIQAQQNEISRLNNEIAELERLKIQLQ